MILGPVSFLDCLVFCIFLAIRLLTSIGLWTTLRCVSAAIPFLILELPVLLIHRALFAVGVKVTAPDAFTRSASAFEVIAVQCTRYCHANLPLDVLKVFFEKEVVLPFFRFRMLSRMRWRSPVRWEEYTDEEADPPIRGIWIKENPDEVPDIVVYYVHGGGFVMGSPHFYLEFLIAFHSMLRESFKNPAIFLVGYSLAPGSQYPTQPRQILNGYAAAISVARSSSRVCVMGDSAGGALALTLLRDLQTDAARQACVFDQGPEFMVLVSPWATLVSDSHQESASDYLSVTRLHMFAQLYAPDKARGGVLREASPSGMMRAADWMGHGPRLGYLVWYGEDEVFAPDIREAVRGLTDAGAVVQVEKRKAGNRSLHVWPLVSFFLASNQTRRLEELRVIVDAIAVMMG